MMSGLSKTVGAAAIARLCLRNLLSGKRGVAAVVLLLIAPLIAGIVAGVHPTHLSADELFKDISFAFILKFLVLLLPLIYGIALTSGEIEDGTVGYLYLSFVPRWLIALLHFGVTAIVLSLMSAMSVLLTALACAIGPGADLASFLSAGVRLSIVTTVAIAVYLAFFMFCGFAFKRPLVVGIFSTFIWEIFVTDIPAKLAAWTVTNNLYSLWYYLVLRGDRGRWLRHVRNFTLPTYPESSMFLTAALGLFLTGAMVAAMNRSVEGKETRQ